DVLPPRVRGPGRHRRAARDPPGVDLAPEAHPVPRPAPAGGQRRGLPALAYLRRPVGGPALRGVRGARPSRRAGPDQPGLALGPYVPAAVTQTAQPDWYVGWLEGALRLFPNWEVNAFGYQIPNPFFPGVLLPLLTFAGLYVYPFVERRLTGDDQEHELLDRPRDRPFRTAFGAGVLTFYVVLFVAGSHDVLATWVGLSVQAVTWVLRVLLFVLPVVGGVGAHRWSLDLAEGRNEPVPVEAHRS